MDVHRWQPNRGLNVMMNSCVEISFTSDRPAGTVSVRRRPRAPRRTVVNRPHTPRGSVLVVVLVIVMLLTLGAYGFTQLMLSEAEATSAFERAAQARIWADSGIEFAATVLGDRLTVETTGLDLYNAPELFQGVMMRDSDNPRRRGRFSIVAAAEGDVAGQGIRFGLVDESGKLNLNTLFDFDLDDEQQQDRLLALPDMTIELANAILDWLDEDEEPRQNGAENEYYGTLDPPYETQNGPLESLAELLQVRGVTPGLLYGEDANRNGLLDPNENDGDLSLPADNADGVLQSGWSAHLTVLSREANRRSDGNPRIDVNQQKLAELYDAVLAEFDEETARFITAYRLFGPLSDTGAGAGTTSGPGSSGGSGSRSGGSASTGQTPSGSTGGSGTQSNSSSGSSGSGGGTRGGLNLSRGGGQKITSLYDLIGARVRATVNGQQQVLESPWDDDQSSLSSYLPKLMDTLTTTTGPFIEGRINIAHARREVLLSIPDIDEQLVEMIIAAQLYGGASEADESSLRSTSGWLVTEGLVELDQMRTLDRFITGRGDVYRLQVLGYYDAGGPVARLEAIIDATQIPPRVIAVRNLTDLGRGYSLEQLLQSSAGF